jgi:hypothetical protein
LASKVYPLHEPGHKPRGEDREKGKNWGGGEGGSEVIFFFFENFTADLWKSGKVPQHFRKDVIFLPKKSKFCSKMPFFNKKFIGGGDYLNPPKLKDGLFINIVKKEEKLVSRHIAENGF